MEIEPKFNGKQKELQMKITQMETMLLRLFTVDVRMEKGID